MFLVLETDIQAILCCTTLLESFSTSILDTFWITASQRKVLKEIASHLSTLKNFNTSYVILTRLQFKRWVLIYRGTIPRPIQIRPIRLNLQKTPTSRKRKVYTAITNQQDKNFSWWSIPSFSKSKMKQLKLSPQLTFSKICLKISHLKLFWNFDRMQTYLLICLFWCLCRAFKN